MLIGKIVRWLREFEIERFDHVRLGLVERRQHWKNLKTAWHDALLRAQRQREVEIEELQDDIDSLEALKERI